MPAGAIKALLAQVEPLCKYGVPAEPQDLVSFWVCCEAAIKSLDASFLGLHDENLFIGAHVQLFAPLLLAPVGW